MAIVGALGRAVLCSDIGIDGRPGSAVIADVRAEMLIAVPRYRDRAGKLWQPIGSAWASETYQLI